MAARVVRQARAERTRAAVLLAAAEVFSENGFSGSSVLKIADRAGVTLGAVYFHFRSKEELAGAILAGQPEFVDLPEGAPGLQRAIDVTKAWARQLAESPLLRAGARLAWEQDRFMPAGENSHQQWTSIMADDLQTAADNGELKPEVHIQVLARMVVNACTGAQVHSYVETAHEDLVERVEEIWRCLMPALGVTDQHRGFQPQGSADSAFDQSATSARRSLWPSATGIGRPDPRPVPPVDDAAATLAGWIQDLSGEVATVRTACAR